MTWSIPEKKTFQQNISNFYFKFKFVIVPATIFIYRNVF